MQLPTPSTRHVSFDNVYEPSEDSYLFLDTLSSATETQWLEERFEGAPSSSHRTPYNDRDDTGNRNGNSAGANLNVARTATATPLVVELGPGSGVIIAFLTAHSAGIFGHGVLSLAVDVNWHACVATRTTVETALAETETDEAMTATTTTTTRSSSSSKKAGGSSRYLASLNGDLGGMLRPGAADVVIFNPPYVPTENVPPVHQYQQPTSSISTSSSRSTPSFEESSHLLSLSYAGGRDGMEVTNRMLKQLPGMLSARGVAYVLFCRGNRPEEVKEWIRGWDGHLGEGGGSEEKRKWHAETVGESGKTAGWEKLEIVRIWRE